jgi:hypothetical protein
VDVFVYGRMVLETVYPVNSIIRKYQEAEKEVKKGAFVCL